MVKGTVHRTIQLLEEALTALDAKVPLRRIEAMGVMVNRAMSSHQRSFHTPEHIFDLADHDNPHTTLAAVFHDVVYYHVDRGVPDDIQEIVSPYVEWTDNGVRLAADVPETERAYWGCMSVFGFQPGQELSAFGGLNEFLSALLMDCLLEGVVDDHHLLVTTACIEATIPFRRPDKDGRTPADNLEERLLNTNQAFGLELTHDLIVKAVQAAVSFANRDVWNLAEMDVGRFLDNTWKLLPETNPWLRVSGVYSVNSYRVALQKMEGFLNSLDPSCVFNQFRGVPDDNEYERLNGYAHRNVAMARKYLGIKLLTTGIIEALAELSGGDAPMSYFMGDLNADKGDRLIDFLPDYPSVSSPESAEPEFDPTLHSLLAVGRAKESQFDLQNSPLSLYVYRCLGETGRTDYLDRAREMFVGNSKAEQFLLELPAEMVTKIALACGEMAFTRRESLNEFASRLK